MVLYSRCRHYSLSQSLSSSVRSALTEDAKSYQTTATWPASAVTFSRLALSRFWNKCCLAKDLTTNRKDQTKTRRKWTCSYFLGVGGNSPRGPWIALSYIFYIRGLSETQFCKWVSIRSKSRSLSIRQNNPQPHTIKGRIWYFHGKSYRENLDRTGRLYRLSEHSCSKIELQCTSYRLGSSSLCVF